MSLGRTPQAGPADVLADVVAPGHLLISVSRNSADFQEVIDDPKKGRPHFAEIDEP